MRDDDHSVVNERIDGGLVDPMIYDEHDRTWDTNTWPASQVNTWTPDQPSDADAWKKQPRYLGKSGEIVGKSGGDDHPNSLKSFSESDRTNVNREEHIKRTELVEVTDCAEARLAAEVREAQAYLTTIEALAASNDRDQIRFEQLALARLANDTCLPEAIKERAARLLSKIG